MKCNCNRMGVSVIFVLLLSTVFLNCAQKQSKTNFTTNGKEEKSIFGVYETKNGTIIRIAQGNDTECVVSIGKQAFIGKIVGNGVKLYTNQIESNGVISFVNGVVMVDSTCDTIFYYETLLQDIYKNISDFVSSPLRNIFNLKLTAYRLNKESK